MAEMKKNPENLQESGQSQKERSILTGFILGLFTLAPQVIAFFMSGSITMLSSSLRSGSESIANFLSWLTIRKVYNGKNNKYDYGFGKLENMSSLFVAGVLTVSFIVIITSTYTRFIEPSGIGFTGALVGIGSTIFSLSINITMWIKFHRLSKQNYSPVIESQWRLFRAKSIVNFCVLISLGMCVLLRDYEWSVYIDPTGSLVISGFLLYSAYSVISMSLYDLLDKTVEESIQLIILRELAENFHNYNQVHRIRSRRSGGKIYIEIFLEFEGEKKMKHVQAVIDRMKTGLESRISGSFVAIIPERETVKAV